MAKKKSRAQKPVFNPERLRCVRGRPKKGESFCFEVKAEGTGSDKVHVVQYRHPGKGKVFGWLGPGCTVVWTRDQARTFDYLNASAADWETRDCLYLSVAKRRDPRVREARRARKAAEKAAEKAAHL